MLKSLARLFFSFVSNVIALGIATYLVSGFEIHTDFPGFLEVALVFTLINAFLRPIFKLILSPVIILTFGLGIILLNMSMLYLLTLLSPNIKIVGLGPLIYATLIVGIINALFHFFMKEAYGGKNKE